MSESALGEASGDSSSNDKELSCPDCGKEYESYTGVQYHLDTSSNDCVGFECSECDKRSMNERGLKQHLAREHDITGSYYKRLSDREWFYKQYVVLGNSTADIAETVGCSKPRALAWKQKHGIESITAYKSRGTGNDNPNSDRLVVECDHCHSEISRPRSKVEKNEYNFCDRACQASWASNRTGQDNPLYKGGPIYYGKGWKEARTKRLESDDRECRVCSSGECLEVHHIKPVRSFEEPERAHYQENLITLCQTCHSKWEGIPLRPEVIDSGE